MFVRSLFVFDLLFNLFRIVLWHSVGKELSPWLFTCTVFILVPSYEGQSINSNNGSITRIRIIYDAKCGHGNAYLCEKYGVFIKTRVAAMRICI